MADRHIEPNRYAVKWLCLAFALFAQRCAVSGITDAPRYVEDRKLTEIKPYQKNPRRNDEAIDAVARSIEQFGFRQPIVVDKHGVIVVGHTRWKAAKKLGLTSVPVHVAADLSPQQARAYRLADNKTGELAQWDFDQLSIELTGLIDGGFDIDTLGFNDDELAKLINGGMVDGLTDPDAVPEPPATPVTKAGELWLLGEHRLLCGDATKAEDVGRLMGGEHGDLWLTDPPYNVDYTGKTKDALKITNDSMEGTDFRKFLVASFRLSLESINPGASFYIWHADSDGYNFRGAIHDCRQAVRQCLIWKKHALVMGRQDYHWMHEPCLYGWKDGAPHGWFADRKQTTVLEFNRPLRSKEHPTMKPVALFAYLINNSTAPHGLVYDPFLGSGTALIAAEQLGRRCYGLEISPQYCDVIIQRYEQFTGKKAERSAL